MFTTPLSVLTGGLLPLDLIPSLGAGVMHALGASGRAESFPAIPVKVRQYAFCDLQKWHAPAYKDEQAHFASKTGSKFIPNVPLLPNWRKFPLCWQTACNFQLL